MNYQFTDPGGASPDDQLDNGGIPNAHLGSPPMVESNNGQWESLRQILERAVRGGSSQSNAHPSIPSEYNMSKVAPVTHYEDRMPLAQESHLNPVYTGTMQESYNMRDSSSSSQIGSWGPITDFRDVSEEHLGEPVLAEYNNEALPQGETNSRNIEYYPFANHSQDQNMQFTDNEFQEAEFTEDQFQDTPYNDNHGYEYSYPSPGYGELIYNAASAEASSNGFADAAEDYSEETPVTDREDIPPHYSNNMELTPSEADMFEGRFAVPEGEEEIYDSRAAVEGQSGGESTESLGVQDPSSATPDEAASKKSNFSHYNKNGRPVGINKKGEHYVMADSKRKDLPLKQVDLTEDELIHIWRDFGYSRLPGVRERCFMTPQNAGLQQRTRKFANGSEYRRLRVTTAQFNDLCELRGVPEKKNSLTQSRYSKEQRESAEDHFLNGPRGLVAKARLWRVIEAEHAEKLARQEEANNS